MRPEDLAAESEVRLSSAAQTLLAAEDALDMVARAQVRLDEGCLLWDAEGLARTALAILVHRQLAEGRVRRSAGLVARALEAALEQLVYCAPPGPAVATREDFEVVGLPLGVGGAAAARACRAHNRCEPEARRAFRGLVILGQPLDGVAHSLGWDAGRTARAAREVLLQFFQEIRTPSEGDDVLDAVVVLGRPQSKVPS